MKEKEILKNLKQEARNIEPQLQTWIGQYFPKPKRRRWMNLLPVATLITSVMVITLLVSNLDPISPSSESGSSLPTSETSTTPSSSIIVSSEIPSSSEPIVLPPLQLANDQQALSISSMTTATLVNQLNLGATLNASLPQLAYGSQSRRETFNFEETMMLLKPYLSLFEQLVGKRSAPVVESIPSDRAEFAYLNQFSVYDLQGNLVNYALYFNLSDVEIIAEEEFYLLTGELWIGNNVPLVVTGSKRIEDEETTVRFRAEIDGNNFVATRYRYEEDETKIMVLKRVNGVDQLSYFKLEVEDEEVVVELMFLEENDEKRIRDRFKFEYEEDLDQARLEIKYEMQVANRTVRGKITVVVIPVLDEFGNVTGYAYQALQYNENGEQESEWQDDRRDPRDHNEDDEDEDDNEDEDEENDEDEDDEEDDDDE